MSYKKVYYDEIWQMTSEGTKKSQEWQEQLKKLYEAINLFGSDGKFVGETAESIIGYIEQIHGTVISSIGSILAAYVSKAGPYYKGYKQIDAGDRFTTFVSSELDSNGGSIKKKLEAINNNAYTVASEANTVKNNVSHLVRIYASPNLGNLQTEINNSINKIKNLDKQIKEYETSKKNDFSAIDTLISEVERIINYQLGKSRVPVAKYQNGQIGSMCDIQKLYDANVEAGEIYEEFLNSEDYEEIMNLMLNREALVAEENEKERGWVRWIAIGVAVVGSVVLTVVTAGGATPLTCAIVGGVVGGTSVAANKFADNYVDNASLTEGMKWNEFGKEVLVGTVTGAVGGCFGGMSQGSAIKQPFENAVMSVARGMTESVAQDATNTLWDVGEAIVTGKPGDQVLGVLSDGIETLGKNAISGGVGNFATGYLEGKFGINTGDKGYFNRVKEKFVTDLAGDAGEEIAKGVFDVGDALVNGGDVQSVIISSGREIISDIGENVGEAFVGEAFEGDAYKKILKGNKTADVIKDGISAGITESGKDVIRGVSGRTYDVFTGEGEVSDIFDKDKIIEEDLNYGENVAVAIGEGGAKTAMKEKAFTESMKDISYEKNGKQMVDIVDFGEGKPKVTKQDYDAARRVAGEGEYSDKTTKEILGLSDDTLLKDAKIRSVRYDRISKDSSQKGDTQATYIKVTNKTNK